MAKKKTTSKKSKTIKICNTREVSKAEADRCASVVSCYVKQKAKKKGKQAAAEAKKIAKKGFTKLGAFFTKAGR